MRRLEHSVACDLPEAEVIRMAQQGDAAAFESLYHLHSRRVFAVCLRMLENTAEAEDLTQETFLTVFRKIGLFRGESSFSTWLHRVTVNLVLMHIRKKVLPQTSLDDFTDTGDESGASRIQLGERDPHLEGFVDRVSLERAIDQLPSGFKISFVLHDIQGYRHKEIAEILGCSAGTSKSQLHKARLRLRELLLADRQCNIAREYRPVGRASAPAFPSGVRTLRSSGRSGAVRMPRRDKDAVFDVPMRMDTVEEACAGFR